MDTLHPHCAGLDVHQDTVVACVRHVSPNGHVTKSVRTFATWTAGLLELADWLSAEGVTHVAMESTGAYWKPVYHILEGAFTLLLVSASHRKKVPGRKTDVKDCEWIAQLLQHGLLRPSFVPPAPARELRELTRQRAQLVADESRVANRIQQFWRTPTSSWVRWLPTYWGNRGGPSCGPWSAARPTRRSWPSWR